MAIGAVARGDLVVVHSNKYNLRGLFIVDSVNGNLISVLKSEDANLVAGGTKANAVVIDKTTDILAVHTASSISDQSRDASARPGRPAQPSGASTASRPSRTGYTPHPETTGSHHRSNRQLFNKTREARARGPRCA